MQRANKVHGRDVIIWGEVSKDRIDQNEVEVMSPLESKKWEQPVEEQVMGLVSIGPMLEHWA